MFGLGRYRVPLLFFLDKRVRRRGFGNGFGGVWDVWGFFSVFFFVFWRGVRCVGLDWIGRVSWECVGSFHVMVVGFERSSDSCDCERGWMYGCGFGVWDYGLGFCGDVC